VELFERGGNAFDVAVATGFVLAVVHPQAGNIGGGGFAVVRDGVSGQVRALDFRETAPGAASETMFQDEAGRVIEGMSRRGTLAAGVPGTPAGLYELWRAYGSLPWEELVQTAADLADTGFIVTEPLARDFERYSAELSLFESTRQTFLPNGRPAKAGERLVQPDLAATLYKIAAEGPSAFYEGEVAVLIDSTMRLHGGIMTGDDLAAYSPQWRSPVHFMFDSLDIYSMSPPSSGGLMVGQILKLLEPFDTRAYNPNHPDYLHRFVEACRLAFADRAVHLGDPEFWSIPSGLLDDAYLSRRREDLPLDRAGISSQVSAGNPAAGESDETTHISVCDGQGNMVALTYTLNTSFGSKLVVADAGFLLNNEMDDFAAAPNHPNVYGLVGGEANKVEPGKRMLSSMSPTLVLHRDRPYLILGSPGGSRIISSVAQTLFCFVRFGLSLREAVAQPRIHHQWLPDMVKVERGGYSAEVLQRLRNLGHEVEEVDAFSDVQAIAIDPAGLMTAVSDPRNSGKASGL
jgi:gamma-glutamyltranspeptidase/glutathione hydrolase